MREQPARPFVFLSYARADEAYVTRLLDDLLAQDIAVWIDRTGISPSTPDWEQAIRDAIAQATVVVLVASPRAWASSVVSGELALAKRLACPVYPFWVDGENWIECIPPGWEQTQYLDGRQ